MKNYLTNPDFSFSRDSLLCCLKVVKGRIFSFAMFLMFLLIIPFAAFSQSNPNESLWTNNGWSLKKVVSNTSIPSGVNFSYTIIFSAPAGTSSISIQDLVPSTLQVVSVTAAGPVCTVTPVTTTVGNLVTYNLTGLPGSCAPMGSFTIVVKFPEGVTCNGAVARNMAEIQVNGKWESSGYVSTTASAVNPWKVTKTIIAKASVNPNGGNCGYIMAPGDTITYRLAVLKDNPYFGNVTGQQNMNNAVVTDALPAGAQFISSTNPTCVSFSGSTITWNVNCSPVTVPAQLLDAANPWAYYWVDVKVKYPVGSFPVSTQILNQATLTGISCTQQYSNLSNQTCITVTPANPSGQFGKYLQLANRVPGCAGMYYIVFCNNGNVPLSAFNINDAIPSGIAVNSVQIYGANATTTMNLVVNGSPFATGINNSYNSGALTGPPVTSLQFQMTGSLPVGGCIYMYVNFTINPNPVGTVVNNCATFNGLANPLTLPPSCASFTVAAGAPVPCLLKDICSPLSSYKPGDIVRFRIRVQNIGSATMTGTSIQDILHSNFTYLGNECYFTSTTYNPGCSVGSTPPSGSTPWTGVTSLHSGNNLQWSIPAIASNCQLFYTNYCGYYGTYGIPYYYIEFDAKVANTALPGVTPNSFQISGGNLSGTTPSNTVNILIAASFGQEVTKFVSTDNGANYTGSGTTAPGSTVKYRMNFKNTSNVAVSNIRLIDLLPKDAVPNDYLIFNRSINRGSQFSVNYVGNHLTSLSPTGIAPTSTKQWATGTNICLPPYVALGCNATTWGATPTSNLQVNYGSYNLAPAVNLREDFDVSIPLTAQNGQTVCNDFAAIANANFLLNGTPTSVALTPVAAPPVCLNIVKPVLCCDSVKIQQVGGINGATGGCCAKITTTCKVDSVTVNIFGGTIGNVSWNCGALPTNYSGTTNFTFPANGCVLNMTTCFNIPQAGVPIITYTIHFSSGEKCTRIFDLICNATPPNCCDSIQTRIVQNPTVPNSCCVEIRSKCKVDSIKVTVLNGTFSSASWNCGPIPAGYTGQSTYTFNANNCAADLITCITPKQTGSVTINYTVYLPGGVKCDKSIKLDCSVPTCCDKTKVERILNSDGTASCCVKLTTQCDVKSVNVAVTNGTIASTSWNCTAPVPPASIGQSNYTFAPGCAVIMSNCFNAKVSGIVTVTYTINFSNGETCTKKIELDCAVPPAHCCDSIQTRIVQSPNKPDACCTEIISKCKVDSIKVSVLNGTLSSATWNCGAIPVGYIGQSSYTFIASGCAADLVTCVTAKQTGVVTINYVVYMSNGEICQKQVKLDCTVPINCCDSIQVRQVQNPVQNSCCAEIISKCKVDSIKVSVLNGTISSATWNCGTIPSGYAGQSIYTFKANNCAADLITCVTAKQTGVVTINYVVYLPGGVKCEKSLKLDCVAPVTCCDKTKVEKVLNSDGTASCCLKLTTECEVKSVKIDIINGTFASAAWNCATPIPTGYVGQSSYTFAPGCAVTMTSCFDAIQTGIVIVNYTITFQNGEVCKKVMDLDCNVKPPVNCCDSIQMRQVAGSNGTVGCCYEIRSKCNVDSIKVTLLNGTLASASWNCGAIPAGYVGQSTYTFKANNCPADLITCINPKQTGTVTINYVVYMSNKEKCEKTVKFDCQAAANCCDKTKVEKVQNSDGTYSCCIKLTTECEVKSVKVDVSNGTISSTTWNCGAVPPGYAGQSSYTFAANGCVVNMTNCFSAVQTGFVTVSYTITYQNGETCKKVIELDCAAVPPYNCCDSIQTRVVQNPADPKACCMEIKSKCEVDSIKIGLINGTFTSATWNCGTMPTGFIGQSTYTFKTAKCVADLIFCVKAKQAGVVTVNYIIYLSNGQKCEKSVKMDCVFTAINQKNSVESFEFINLFPNPGNGNFNITYSTGKTRDIEIHLINPVGQVVKRINRRNETPGTHTVNIDVKGVAAGIYQVILRSSDEVLQKSAVIKE